MNSFISLAEAAAELAGAGATEADVEVWASILEQHAEQMHAVKSWTSLRHALPGGVSFSTRRDEWRIPRATFNAWRKANGMAFEGAVSVADSRVASSEKSVSTPVLNSEPVHVRQARRYQMCLDAGLAMPKDDYSAMPRGIGAVAKREGIKRQSFTEDVKEHIRRTFKE